MKNFIFLLSLLYLLLVVGCKKENFQSTPATAKPTIAIALNKQYLDGANLDSATVGWEINGQKKTVNMEVKNDSLFADINQFNEGNGKLSFELFSTIKINQVFKIQWVQEKQISLLRSNSILLSGPTGYDDANWKPRVRLFDGINHLAVVALRPEDPYFLVKNVPDSVKKLTVAREFWKTKGGLQQVAVGEWNCTSNCREENGDVVNTTFFNNLPQMIGNKQWNHLEIVVLYEIYANGGGHSISLAYDVN